MPSDLENVNNLILNTDYRNTNGNVGYVQIENTTINVVPVGPLCNSDGPNSKKINDLVQYWNITDSTGEGLGDSIGSCIKNAARLINKQSFEEMSNIHNDSRIRTIPGLYVNIVSNPIYAKGDVNIFLNNQGVMPPSSNFDTLTLQKLQGIELFGYFCPNVSGTWKMSIPTFSAGRLYSKLWISDDNALFDYTNTNADICNDEDINGIATNFTTITVAAGSIIPFRVHVITTSAFNGDGKFPLITAQLMSTATPVVGVTTPLPIVNKNTNHNYFITLTQDGNTPYYKQLMYLALLFVQPSKYKCFFFNTTPENCKTIQELKLNPQLQYITTAIPTPLTSIVKGSITAGQNKSTNVNAPLGIPLNIDKGSWGQQPYQYTDTTTKITQVDRYHPEYTVNKDGKIIKLAAGYTPENVTTTQTTQKDASQMRDVTQIDQSQVSGGSSLNINSSQYSSLYPNPVDPRNTNPGTNNNYVDYSYRPDQTKYSDKQILLDQSGNLMIQYSYDGTRSIEPITLTQPLSQIWKGPGNCPYVLRLENVDTTVRLSIKNGETTLGFMTVLDSNKDSRIRSSKVNSQWLRNLQDTSGRYITQLPVKTPLIQNQNAFITSDGKFKLFIDNNKIIIVYGIKPYTGININNNLWSQTEKSSNNNLSIIIQPNNVINYTTNNNVDNNNQMYYFYRIPSRGLAERIFLMEYSDTLNTQRLHNVPTNSNNILEYKKNTFQTSAFKTIASAYVLNDPINYSIQPSTTSDNCKNSCQSSDTCDHSFFMKTVGSVNGNGTCYVDNKNNNNPIYSNNNSDTSKYTDGTLFKKQYSIINDCVNNKLPEYKNQIHQGMNDTIVDRFDIVYKPVENHPELTYYCGLPWYVKNKQDMNTIWKGTENKQGFQNIEAFTNNCVNSACSTSNINEIQPLANYYTQTQDTISQTYNITQNRLKQLRDLSNNLADPIYKYNGPDSIVPTIFVNSKDPKPSENIIDGQITDMKQTLLVHNTMYTLASITAASFIIIGILLGRE